MSEVRNGEQKGHTYLYSEIFFGGQKVQAINTESRSTVVCCVWTEFGRHYRYIVNKGTGDDGGYGCEFIIVLTVRGQEESALS